MDKEALPIRDELANGSTISPRTKKSKVFDVLDVAIAITIAVPLFAIGFVVWAAFLLAYAAIFCAGVFITWSVLAAAFHWVFG